MSSISIWGDWLKLSRKQLFQSFFNISILLLYNHLIVTLEWSTNYIRMALPLSAPRSKRLCEFFVVVGIVDFECLNERIEGTTINNINELSFRFVILLIIYHLFLNYNMKISPEVLNRYPYFDVIPFPTGLANFSFPHNVRLTHEMKLPSYFSFVHTDAEVRCWLLLCNDRLKWESPLKNVWKLLG